ncbi:hypothetical protein ACJVC5_03585 [Peredibacter sp. HCB2-198]|uniref:hypothetical protein n=1 Tax=Peredibacter sp. HCB2-198 TaxID=3383025 RepID=UPI0038B54685
MFEIIKRWKSPRSTSSNAILTLCVITIFNQSLALLHAAVYKLSGSFLMIRIIHGLAAFIILGILATSKKTWPRKTSIIVFTLMVLPMFILAWETEILFSKMKYWIPLLPFKSYVTLLSFLVPGPYILNLGLITLFCLQAIFTWFYLDIPNAPNVILISEPYLSLMFTVTAFCILAFRYRDQKIIEELSKQKAQAEVYEKVARIFLSMRDKVNTPLQSQNLLVGILKKNPAIKAETIAILERSIESLERNNNILKRLELNLPEKSYDLMSEEEILSYLDQLERKSK